MPHQTGLRHSIDIGADTKVGLAVNVKRVEGDKDGRIFPELDVVEGGFVSVLKLRLIRNICCIVRKTENVFFILWVCDPTGLCSVQDGVTPALDSEREFIHVNVGSGCPQAPIMALAEIDVTQENNDLGGGNEWMLEVDTHGCRVIRIYQEIAHVLAIEVLQIGGYEDEPIIYGTVESGFIPRGDVAVCPSLRKIHVG